MTPYIAIPLISGFFGLAFASMLALRIRKEETGKAEVAKISSYIRDGALAFLHKECRVLVFFVIFVAAALSLTPIGWQTAVSFVAGAIFSALAGNIGMRIATIANGRTAWATTYSQSKALYLAFSSGSVMGLTVVSLGLLGITSLFLIFKDPQIIYGFGFGASAIAIFARVGGGIYTKAADVGADLVGKVEKGIPEDDPRNPAVIADNVGDNVGDVAGMGADLFESYVGAIVSTMVLGMVLFGESGGRFTVLPLLIAGIGIFASILGNFVVKHSNTQSPHAALNRGTVATTILTACGAYFAINWFLQGGNSVFWALMAGLLAGLSIGFITELYTSYRFAPTREVSRAAQTGAGTNLIAGLALGMKSTVVPVLLVSAAILVAYRLAGLYGIAIAAVGMLSTLGITLAADTYGPVADNAAGIAEMAKLGEEARTRAEELDAVGNTTAAIGKGFAIGSAALTALVLAVSYAQVAQLKGINLLVPQVTVSIFLGGLLPFIFSALAIQAVGRAAFSIVTEVRRQWNEIPGVAEGTTKPDYGRCVAICTQAALKEMIAPGFIAVAAPVAVGFLLGKEALGGFLVGAIASGFMLAIMMANSGGAWDNAKKYIEAGNFGGKGSNAHKASVVGDTVGDPFKDTAGPSLNILIKLMAIISLIIAPIL